MLVILGAKTVTTVIVNQHTVLTHALNNSFTNIQLKFSTTMEIENVIKTLKPKKEMKYPLSYLQLAVLILVHLEIIYVIHPFYQGLFLNT
jgi:hypothetical protein